MSWGTGRKR